MRIGTGLLVASLGLGVASAASAQTVSLDIGTDSVLAILTGDTGTAELRVVNTPGVGVSAYDITVFFDSSRVRLVGADSVPGFGLPSPAIVLGTDQATLTASGTGSTSSVVSLATLFFEMDGAALSGSFISVKVNSLTAGDGVTPLVSGHRTDVLDVCQAEETWGDIDGNRTINSRDALITLTAAVGLSVGSFDAGLGDVDQDAQVTSRDALFILSSGIGLFVPSWIVVGEVIANYCGPLEPMPNDMAYWSSGSLAYTLAGDTVRNLVGVTGSDAYYPSWAPDGSRIVYTQFVSGWGYDFISVVPDGSAIDTLFVSTAHDYAPAWSPDGTRMAFVSTQLTPTSIWVMNADGTGQARVTDTITVTSPYRVSWSPDGSMLTFAGWNSLACCTPKLWTINADGTGLQEVFPSSASHAPREPVWSPAGDSIAYDYSGVSRIYRVASPSTVVGGPASSLQSGQDYPEWSIGGIVFAWQGWAGFYMNRAIDGRHLRLTRAQGSIQRRPAVRLTGAYVDTVTVSPASATISVSGQPDPTTVQLAASVVDNSGSPIIPGSRVQWTSSDPNVAAVDQNGLVTAVAQGSVTITATTGGWRSGTASVTVNP